MSSKQAKRARFYADARGIRRDPPMEIVGANGMRVIARRSFFLKWYGHPMAMKPRIGGGILGTRPVGVIVDEIMGHPEIWAD